jgi:hypothetical protein
MLGFGVTEIHPLHVFFVSFVAYLPYDTYVHLLFHMQCLVITHFLHRLLAAILKAAGSVIVIEGGISRSFYSDSPLFSVMSTPRVLTRLANSVNKSMDRKV